MPNDLPMTAPTPSGGATSPLTAEEHKQLVGWARERVARDGAEDFPQWLAEQVLRLDAALLAARRGEASLRNALIAHRADLHNGSKRPCPTCRQSAKALGIDGKVPDSCAYAETDRAALAATPEGP